MIGKPPEISRRRPGSAPMAAGGGDARAGRRPSAPGDRQRLKRLFMNRKQSVYDT